MDEHAWILHWQEIHKEVFLLGSPAMSSRIKPTSSHIDRLESALKVSLPFSYRAFVTVFGPGRISQSVDIFSPGYQGLHVIDFVGNNRWQEDEAIRRNAFCQTNDLLSFANLNHQPFVWNTRILTNTEEREYEIFYLPNEPSEPLIRICDSFPEFIEDWCFTGKYWEILGSEAITTWEDEETGQIHSMKCFFPIGEKPTSAV